jgi:hypothetical protein
MATAFCGFLFANRKDAKKDAEQHTREYRDGRCKKNREKEIEVEDAEAQVHDADIDDAEDDSAGE